MREKSAEELFKEKIEEEIRKTTEKIDNKSQRSQGLFKDFVKKAETPAVKKPFYSEKEIDSIFKSSDEIINKKHEEVDTAEIEDLYKQVEKAEKQIAIEAEEKTKNKQEEVEIPVFVNTKTEEKFSNTAELKKIYDSLFKEEDTHQKQIIEVHEEVPETKEESIANTTELKKFFDDIDLKEFEIEEPKITFNKTKENVFKETKPTIKSPVKEIKEEKAPDESIEKSIDEIKEKISNTKLPSFDISKPKEKVIETIDKVKEVPITINLDKTIKKTGEIISATVDVVNNEVEEIKKEFTSSGNGGFGGGTNDHSYGDEDNGPRPKTTKKIKILATIVSAIVGLGVICAIGAAIFGFSLIKDKPEFDKEKLISSDSSIIYDANGNEIVELGLYLRESIDYEEMPNSLIDAFLSIEDSRFFQHFGFDIPRFTKAAFANLASGGFGQGGSTMTMQLVKNSYFQIDADGQSTLAASSGMAGVKRKAQEIILAMECDKKLSKKDTIALYINKINFGNNIRGVQKAAEYYFGKDAKDLNLVESCFLAGIINSPNNYNPYNELYKNNDSYIYLNSEITYLENAQNRTAEVLDLMEYHGYITKEEAALAKTIKIEDLLSGVDDKFSSYSVYYQDFIDAVIDEAQVATGKDPYTTSMDIYTTMDPYMQQRVYEIESEQTDLKYTRDLEQSAFVVLNNQTGELVALGGGRNQQAGVRQFNRATSAYLQPGSVMKPILEYALAFDKLGWSTAHTITDKPVYLYNSKILIVNAGGQEYTGDMLVTEAIARSLNSPAIQALEAVIEEIEEDGVKDYLKQIGFTQNIDSFDLQWGIGGNTCVITPVKLAAAHGMLVNDGYYVAPHTIKKIVCQNGDEYIADTTGKQVISSAAAYMTAMCEENNVSGEFFNLMQILRRDYPVYAKTGTTDWGNSGRSYGIPSGAPKDMWMVAQTSNYTVTVWLGFDKAEKGAYFTTSEDMANLKGHICKYLLDELEEHFDYNPHAIERPDDVIDVEIVKGAYPYCVPDGAHETITGLIKASALEEHPLTTVEDVLANLPVKEETESGGLAIKGFVRSEDGVVVVQSSTGGYWCSDGTQNISATNLYGDSTAAIGRCYFPHYVTTGSSYEAGYVTLYVNGEYWNSKETTGYTEFYDVPSEGAELMACVNDSACTTFRR